jgi:hypothetical protein
MRYPTDFPRDALKLAALAKINPTGFNRAHNSGA